MPLFWKRFWGSAALSLTVTALFVISASAQTRTAVGGTTDAGGHAAVSPAKSGAWTPPPAGAVTPKREVKAGDHANRWHGAKLLSIWRGDPKRKEIALTFDDGPHPAFTPRLLDLLQQLHVKATFFLVGKKVEEAPEVVARIVHDGHEIGNHTYHHSNLSKIPVESIESEIQRGNEAIRRACGRTPTLFRPPGGHHDDSILAAAEKLGMTTVLWTDDPADFANPGPDVIEHRILDQVGSGADVLLHDGVEQTLAVLPDLVARLRREGYSFVTMSEMVQHLERTHLGH
jgi:peptidoglycan/xylan/chitin deacetylase (PgdA/CDA1 family)